MIGQMYGKKNMAEIKTIADFASQLVAPLRVLVVDTEPQSFEKISKALGPYNVELYNASCGCEAALCLQKLAPFDLAFVGAPLKTYGTPCDVVKEIQRVSPDASVVIMARNIQDEAVLKLMECGIFTFLKKNGDFDDEHIQKIARQINLPLRPK